MRIYSHKAFFILYVSESYMLYYVVAAMMVTMMKIATISTKIENDAFEFGKYIKHNIGSTIMKELF